MKKITLIFVAGLLLSLSVNAQYELPVQWETELEDTSWTIFANVDDARENFVIVDNPETGGINASAKCLNFIVLEGASPWVGAWSDAYGEIAFTEENHIMQMMVYKDVISRCGIKVENGDDVFEVLVPNTLTDEWELLSFDFTDVIGKSYTRLVFFPDFPEARTAGSNCYIDNIGWEGSVSAKDAKQISVQVFPNPAHNFISVNSPNAIAGIHVFDITGKTLINMNALGSSSAQLNISEFNSGLYIVKIEDQLGNITTKKVQVR